MILDIFTKSPLWNIFICFCEFVVSVRRLISFFVQCSFDFPFWCGACFLILLWCSFEWIWKSVSVNYGFIPRLSSSTMQIRRHMYSDYFDIITLFVDMSMINLDCVSFFADNSSFSFLAVLNLYLNLMYYTDLNEWISFIFSKKIKNFRF
jgi:hypothetical protein